MGQNQNIAVLYLSHRVKSGSKNLGQVIPCLLYTSASSQARGMLALEVLAYLSRLQNTFSMGIWSFWAAVLMIRMLA